MKTDTIGLHITGTHMRKNRGNKTLLGLLGFLLSYNKVEERIGKG